MRNPYDARGFTWRRFSGAEVAELDGEGRCVITDHGALVVFNLVGPEPHILYSLRLQLVGHTIQVAMGACFLRIMAFN